MTGKYISHYRVIEKLAEGGMGVVYKAEDTRLQRTVALKFLPLRSLSSEQDRARFLLEARAAAQLDHPNIATVHEVDEVEGQTFIAMAFVDGPTIAEKLRQGPFALPEAVDIALQTARALREAHEKGVIHRDVKSANVMLTRRGQVKLTDFGLARLASQEITVQRRLQGTPAYMSPEQIQGETVDHRTDIWSLGVMMYEMVTGRLPFRGDYRQALVYAISNEDPEPVASLRPETPAELAEIIEKALAKDPARRYQQIGELMGGLKALQARLGPLSSSAVVTPLQASPPKSKSLVLPAVGGAAVVLVLGLAWFLGSRSEAPPQPPQVTPLTSYPGREEFPSFSPDGNQVAFSWNGERQDNFDIYVKLLDSATALRLTNDPAPDLSPAWAPDGRQIAFLREDPDGSSDVYVVPPLGGAQRKLARVAAAAGWGLTWSRDSRFLAVPDRQSSDGHPGITWIDAQSGEKKWLVAAPAGAHRVLFPSVSPDGTTLAFDVEMGAWLGDTYLVGTQGGGLRRLTFDGGQSEGLAWDTDGSHVRFARTSRLGRRAFWSVPVSGGAPQLVNVGDNPTQPAFSQQPGRWAFSKRISRYDIRLIDTSDPQAEPSLFVSSTQLDANPQFSPDGKRVTFSSSRSGGIEIWISNADGSGPLQLTALEITGSPRWSPDGSRIAFDAISEGNADVYVVEVAGGPPRRMTLNPAEDVVPGWSADGRWLYFASNRGGGHQIWKMRADQPGGDADATQVTRQGGFYPVESPDGRFLYYAKERALETSIWRVPLDGGQETPALDLALAGWGNLTATERGLYFAHRKEEPPLGTEWVVMFLPVGEEKPREVVGMPRFPTLGGPGLSVSPDGRWILVGQIDIDSDLMLVQSQP
jgi:eukaryotic-like serine/threonine-protein kinase